MTTPIIRNGPPTEEDDDVMSELAILISEKKKLRRKVDDLDTKIIGLKEELRRRKEKRDAYNSIAHQDVED